MKSVAGDANDFRKSRMSSILMLKKMDRLITVEDVLEGFL